MSRDHMPGLQALLHAFKRFTGVSGVADASTEARDEPLASMDEGSDDEDVADRSGPRDEACPTTPISVVIANCRGAEATARCLAAVLAQRFDSASFEVVVVDDTASDDVREVVAALTPVGGAPAVRYLRVARGSPTAARNHGWRAANGVLVAFADDRSLPDPDWLAGGERAMRAGHVALGTSMCVPSSKQDTAAEQLRHLQSASAFVRREMLERVGGFHEHHATV